MTMFSFKVQMMRLDLLVSDIRRIHSCIPSEYVQPKKSQIFGGVNILQIAEGGASGGDHTVKKAVKIARKGKDQFLEESIIASEYNIIRDDVTLSKDPEVLSLNEDYIRAMRSGEYRKARRLVERLYSVVAVMNGHSLFTDHVSSNGKSLTVSISNRGNRNASIMSMKVLCGGDEVECSIHAPFVVHPASQVLAVCRSDKPPEIPMEFMIEYNVGVTTRQTYEVKRLDLDYFSEDE